MQKEPLLESYKVLSIDPGYDRCGFAIVEKKVGKKELLLDSGFLQTDAKDSFVYRLIRVIEYISATIDTHKPNFLAIETLFFSTNTKTAMRVAEVRGAILYIAKQRGLSILEINPVQVKVAITGQGKTSKDQMIKMIQLITGINKKTKDDEYDAIAIGFAFISLYRSAYTQGVLA